MQIKRSFRFSRPAESQAAVFAFLLL